MVTDENNASYSNNFTLDGSPSNTIDASGNHSNLTGGFSDADPSQPGQITFDDTVGGGSVTLEGQNTHTGGTTVNDGTLALSGNGTLGADTNTTTVNGGTLDLGGTNQTQQELVQAGGTVQDGTINVDTYTMSDGQLAADATIVASNSFDLSSGDVDGVLDGSGALTKSGSGTVTLTNDNGYTGGTTVNDGTLALSGNGTLGADTNTTTVNGGTLDLGGTNQTQQELVQAGGTVQDGTINVDTYTMSDGQLAADATIVASNSFDLSSGDVDGVLDGSGALTKSGSGTVTLTNDNGYTGGTTVNDGTLALSGNGTLGADTNTTTVNGGTLDLGGTNQTQQQLVQAGGTVQDGTINVDTYTMSDGQLAADATIVASNSFDLSSGDVDGVLDGSGALTKSGSGTVTLTNDNGYTGGTTVNDGTLALSGNGTLGADTNTTTVNGGTLDLGGTNQTQQELVQAGGTVQDGTINVDTYTMSDGQLAADATIVASNSFDLSSGVVDGVLDGSGALTKSGSGTVTLTNDNGYTGGTTVNDGTLALSGNGTLGADANTTTVNGGTLDLGGTNQTQQELVQAGGTVQDGTINVDTYTMSDGQLAADATIVASNSFDLSSGDVDGVLDGSGALTKSGSGTVTLTNDNGYTGGTTVNDGTLALSGNGTLGADTNTTTVNGGTLDLGGTNQTQQELVQAGGTVQDGTINVDTYTMSDGQLAADATIVASNSFDLSSGDVDGVLDGSGALTKSGSGTVTLTNDNGYTGGTTVNDGTLALSGNGTLGADTNTTTVNGGTLDLGGTNQTQQQLVQAGGTVQDGTINVDTYTMSDGQLAADATIVASNSFDLSSGDVDGVLDGSGALAKSGSGTVTLTNDNGYTGGTTVNDGTLALGNGGSSGSVKGDILNNGTLKINRNDFIDLTSNNISGDGNVEFVGGGVNLLGDNNTYSGGTSIENSLVAGSATSFGSGDVHNNGVIVLSQTETGTLSNRLNGGGDFYKIGSAALNLEGDGNFHGNFTVAEGKVAANSHLDQAHFYVSQDAVLTGVGTLGGLTLESGALLATGNNNIGEMAVAGDIYKQNGSLWSVELGQIGSNDALFATGSAHIEEGAVLDVTNISGSRYTLGGAYTVLAANEGVSGRYVLTGDTYVSAFYGLEADYSDANSVVLRVAQTKQYNEINGLNYNQRNVASGLQSLGVGNPLYNAIGYLTNEDDAKNAFTQLSGEIHASARSVAIEDSRFVREAALDRLTSDGTIDTNLYWWSHGFGSDGRFDNTSSNGSSDIDRTIGGGFAGVDVGVSDTWRIGALAGYSHSNFNTRWQTSSAEVQSYHAGVYGGGTVGLVNLRIGGAYSWQDVDTSRTVAFPGFSDNLTASYHNQVTQLFGEVSHPFAINNVTIEPFAGLAYVHLKTDGFTETGGAASLSNDASTDDTLFTTVGFRASVPVSGDGATRLSGSAGWRYAYNDLTPSNSVNFASGSEAFSVGGLPIAKNVAVLELGLERKMTNGLGLEVKYSGQMNGDVQDHGARASLQWKF
ncbi:autotransporter domain-containing protein (plasmid) [Ochrobactrum sp. MT180101]|nr:autotransporter domain-containing protein [Ochrobactrum sp. MT180101]